MKSGRKHATSPYSHGFDCRNTSNYVPLLPFPYQIFNPPTAFSAVILIAMQVYNLIRFNHLLSFDLFVVISNETGVYNIKHI